MSKILVVGASGTVGSELSRVLAAQGHQVRKATSRTPTAADQVQLDVVARRGLNEALSGADAAFLLALPGHANQDELLAPLIDAARAHGLRKVVLMSMMGANADDNAPLRRAERYLEASGLPYNILRPNWFMQNFNTFWLPSIVTQGTILLPVGTAKGSFIDTRDIAAAAAVLLTSDTLANRDFDLTGPEALNHDQVAAILSRESGRRITFQDIPPEAMLDGLLGAGLPKPNAELMVMLLGFFKAGYAERTTDAMAQITGRAPGSFERYARDHRQAWQA